MTGIIRCRLPVNRRPTGPCKYLLVIRGVIQNICRNAGIALTQGLVLCKAIRYYADRGLS